MRFAFSSSFIPKFCVIPTLPSAQVGLSRELSGPALASARSWVPYFVPKCTCIRVREHTHTHTEQSQETLQASFSLPFPPKNPQLTITLDDPKYFNPPTLTSVYCFHPGHFERKCFISKLMSSPLKRAARGVMPTNENCGRNWTPYEAFGNQSVRKSFLPSFSPEHTQSHPSFHLPFQ